MSAILKVQALHKSFGNLHAVRGICFEVPAQTCFGLLGPNGAGKSSTLEMIEGVSAPNKGQILFRDQDLHKNPDLLEKFGVQFQETALPPLLSVREALELFQSLYIKKRPIEELIKRCQLGEFLHQKHNKISGGQRQRLLLALALCQQPELLLLDEPTTGLDPQARRHIWEIIEEIKATGTSIILTTHYMDEAAQLCDEIAIMDHGEIIAQGSPTTLLKEHCGQKVLELSIEALQDSLVLDTVTKRHKKTDSVELHTEDLDKTLRELVEKNISLVSIHVRQSNLEDLFIDLTGRELRS